MCQGIAVLLANFLAFGAGVMALVALVTPHWVKNAGYSTDGTITSFGVVTFEYSNNMDTYYILGNGTYTSLSDWPSNEWAGAYVCLVIGLAVSVVALVMGLVAACLNCFCLCCLSFPFTIISSLSSFISFILYFVSVMLFASKFDSSYNGYGLSGSFCGTGAGSFKLGDCQTEYGLWLAVGAIFASLLA
eukprot:Pgem_evm1s18713